MKKFLFGISFLLININQVSALNCIDLKSNLKRYNESSDVLALQNFLVDKGFLNAKPNGYFGNGTLSAVKKYQKSIGLSQSGQVFPLTRAAIKKETCGTGSANISNNQTSIQQNVVVSSTNPIITPPPVIVPSVPLTSNQKRQQDVINLLTAMYNFYLDSNGTFPVTYITVVPVEVCALGISACDKIVEVKSSLVPKFLTKIPTDPTITSTSTMGTGYFITRSIYGDVKITAPKSDSKEDIFATCNFSVKCKITTAKDASNILGKPTIDSIGKAVFLSGAVMNIPLTINGTNFSSSSNTVTLIRQSNKRVYTLGSFTSATGTTIIATSSFTNTAVSCGVGCSEVPPAGSYEVVVKTSSGESNVGYISLQGVTATSYSNGNDVSFLPKSTHVKLGTVTISSPTMITLKSLVFTLTGSTTLVSKVSNFTLTDTSSGKITNSGPTFSLGDEVISDYKTKIYELYADIADMDTFYAGRIDISGVFTAKEFMSDSTATIQLPKFTISISY